MAIQTARGARIVVHFDTHRCIHSGNCLRGNPQVFLRNVKGDWIHPDAASADEVAEIVRRCPSGALTFERLDGGAAETAPEANTLRVRENGPLEVRADCTVAGEPQPWRVALCRCGLSRRKPFCDNRHTVGGFRASGEPEPPEPESAAPELRGGVLAIEPQRNGPLQLTGSLEILSESGRSLGQVSEAWLCRCGHSKHKPFCDDSHLECGFEADGA
jgi:CDGSH-type Zn-finger protein/uncharacterized Fe-S cluster protein YjdI